MLSFHKFNLPINMSLHALSIFSHAPIFPFNQKDSPTSFIILSSHSADIFHTLYFPHLLTGVHQLLGLVQDFPFFFLLAHFTSIGLSLPSSFHLPSLTLCSSLQSSTPISLNIFRNCILVRSDQIQLSGMAFISAPLHFSTLFSNFMHFHHHFTTTAQFSSSPSTSL